MHLRSRHTTPFPTTQPERPALFIPGYQTASGPQLFPIERSSNPFYSPGGEPDTLTSESAPATDLLNGKRECANTALIGDSNHMDVDQNESYRSTDPDPATGTGFSFPTSATVEAFELTGDEAGGVGNESPSGSGKAGTVDQVSKSEELAQSTSCSVVPDSTGTMMSSQEIPLAILHPLPVDRLSAPTSRGPRAYKPAIPANTLFTISETHPNQLQIAELDLPIARGQKRKRNSAREGSASLPKDRDADSQYRRNRGRSAPAPLSSAEKPKRTKRGRTLEIDELEGQDEEDKVMRDEEDASVPADVAVRGDTSGTFEVEADQTVRMADEEALDEDEEEDQASDQGMDEEDPSASGSDSELEHTSPLSPHDLPPQPFSDTPSSELSSAPDPPSDMYEPVPISMPLNHSPGPYRQYKAILIPSPTKIPNPSPPKRKKASRVIDLLKEEASDVEDGEEDPAGNDSEGGGASVEAEEADDEGSVDGMDGEANTLDRTGTTRVGRHAEDREHAQHRDGGVTDASESHMPAIPHGDQPTEQAPMTGDFEVMQPSDEVDLHEREALPLVQPELEADEGCAEADDEDEASSQVEDGYCDFHDEMCGGECSVASLSPGRSVCATEERQTSKETRTVTTSVLDSIAGFVNVDLKIDPAESAKPQSPQEMVWDTDYNLSLWCNRSKRLPTKRDMMVMQASSELFETQEIFMNRPFADRLETKRDIRSFVRDNEVFDKEISCYTWLKWTIVDRLGEGTFSSVYKAIDMDLCEEDTVEGFQGSKVSPWDSPDRSRHLRTKQAKIRSKRKHLLKTGRIPFVAIKRIYVTSSPQRIANEIELMEEMRGARNISGLITAFREEDQVYAVMPFHENDDFRLFYRRLDPPNIRTYMRCLLRGLKETHRRGIVHRDVKPANFLYDYATGQGYLCDFGLAERYSPARKMMCQHAPATPAVPHGTLTRTHTTKIAERAVQLARSRQQSGIIGFPNHDKRPSMKANRAGTRGFRAPEVLLKCPDQTVAIDIWGAGIILLSILCHKFPLFNSNDDMEGIIELSEVFGKASMERCALLHNRTIVTNCPSSMDRPPLLNMILAVNPRLYDPPAPCCTPEEAKAHIEAIDSLLDLVKQMLRLDATRRYTAHQCLMHPFLQQGLEEGESEKDEKLHRPGEGVCGDRHDVGRNGFHSVDLGQEGPLTVGWGRGLAWGNRPCSFHDGSIRPVPESQLVWDSDETDSDD